MSDETFDLVIVGSGGGGLVAALAAADAGLRPVVLEKQQNLGGSTGMSGGVVWMPNNPLMQAEGVPDSVEEGMAYFDSVLGPPDAGSSLERRRAYLTHGSAMISFLQRRGLRFVRCEGYADYYDDRPGGCARGRSIEGVPWDGNQLGEWRDRIIPGMGRGIGMALRTNEARDVPMAYRTARTFGVSARVVARTYLGKLRHQDLFTNGMSLVGQLTLALLHAGVTLRLGTSVDELVVEDGRVAGVRAVHDGTPTLIRGTRGVLLAAGGFEHNAEMRRKFTAGSDQPADGTYSWGNRGNTGEVLEAAIALGARTEYMDEAIWLPNPRAELSGTAAGQGRYLPRSIMVNAHGARFVNEGNSYMEIGQAMHRHDAVPAWLIFDDVFRRRYPWARELPRPSRFKAALPGRMPPHLLANGWIRAAGTVADLARLIGVPAEALVGTVTRFNEQVASGSDPDFGRGASAYNRALADPGNRPNPALGPLDTGPFYATEVFPADIGTSGGVVCDEFARVLDSAGAPINGLYAAGNMSATVMGRSYLGAGASIGNSMVFGYIAARNAAALL